MLINYLIINCNFSQKRICCKHIGKQIMKCSLNVVNSCLSFHFIQASGVTVADVCKTTYEEIKKDKKHRYVIFYIKDEKQIDVEVIGPRDAAYDAFLEDLQKGGSGECRYGLFDFEYTHQCQGTSEVIFLIYN